MQNFNSYFSLIGIIAFTLASCTKEYYHDTIFEEGAFQISLDSDPTLAQSDPFRLSSEGYSGRTTTARFNLVPVSQLSAAVSFSDKSGHSKASAARTAPSSFDHVMGDVQISLTRSSTGQTYDFTLGAITDVALPEGEEISYTILAGNNDQYQTTLPLTQSSSNTFTVPVADGTIDLLATTNYALVSFQTTATLAASATFAGQTLVDIPTGNSFGEGKYLYVRGGSAGQISGRWTQTVSSTVYSEDFSSASFTANAFNHYNYALGVSYNAQADYGSPASSIVFNVVLSDNYNLSDERIDVSFTIPGQDLNEPNVFDSQPPAPLTGQYFGQGGFRYKLGNISDASQLVVGNRYTFTQGTRSGSGYIYHGLSAGFHQFEYNVGNWTAFTAGAEHIVITN